MVINHSSTIFHSNEGCFRRMSCLHYGNVHTSTVLLTNHFQFITMPTDVKCTYLGSWLQIMKSKKFLSGLLKPFPLELYKKATILNNSNQTVIHVLAIGFMIPLRTKFDQHLTWKWYNIQKDWPTFPALAQWPINFCRSNGAAKKIRPNFASCSPTVKICF